jgi:hypothetical protein
MATQYPITESLVEAFCTAILAFDDWKWGDREPQVFLDGKFLPVSAIANFVSKFNDPMPDGINDFLCKVIGPGNTPTDCTFAAGANSLYRSCMDLQMRRRDNRPASIPTEAQPLDAVGVKPSEVTTAGKFVPYELR